MKFVMTAEMEITTFKNIFFLQDQQKMLILGDFFVVSPKMAPFEPMKPMSFKRRLFFAFFLSTL